MDSTNLMNTCFKADIQCKAPAVDGYEISNLLQEHRLFAPNGFLAESFIKPPVDIKVTFPCLINLHKILLNTKVGEQYSTGFEIFSYSQNQNESAKLDKETLDSRVFSVIGKGTADKNLFSFINKRFQSHFVPRSELHFARTTSNVENLNHDGQSLVVFELTNRRDELLCQVSDVIIRIRNVARGCVCAVKTLEIWGYPSKCVPNHVIQQLLDKQTPKRTLYEYRHGQTSKHISDEKGNTSNEIRQTSKRPVNVGETFQSQNTHVTIPQDFLDALTHDLMTIPMLLPSGYTVDQSSLERHNLEQAKWGRTPSDPFTFKLFSKSYQPVINANLKVRIDEFLLQNPELDVSIRTLGRAEKYISPTLKASSLIKETTETNSPSQLECLTGVAQKRKYTSYSIPGCSRSNKKSTCIENSPVPDVKYGQNKKLKLSEFSNSASGSVCTGEAKQTAHCDQGGESKLEHDDIANTSALKHGASSNKIQIRLDLSDKNIPVPCDASYKTLQACENITDKKTAIHSKAEVPQGVCGERTRFNTANSSVSEVPWRTQLSNSLDNALSSVLSTLPSFTKPTACNIPGESSCAATTDSCVECQSRDIEVLYKLMCEHVICRKCLLKQLSDITCSVCSQISKKKNVIKVHK